MEIKRVIVLVMDGVGAGAAPDAAKYGDEGSHSLANTAREVGGLNLPNLRAIGLGNMDDIAGVPPARNPTGAFGKMIPKSAGKDTITGHWELMGIYLPDPFPTFPNGFPPHFLEEYIRRTGVPGILANRAASGTEIIKELGMEHIESKRPIIYTSADSVFQIAAHEEVYPLPELYRLSEIAREMLTGNYNVGRVIARPFVGSDPENFKRTNNRRDFPRVPDDPTTLDLLVEAGKEVYTVGKIDDIFGHRGITKSNHVVPNAECMWATVAFLQEDFEGLLFTNLIEYDMIYGHRNDAPGYAAALESFDQHLPEIIENLRPTDLAIIASDHGVDPTTASTDHSRECSPLLVFGPPVMGGVNLGTRETFSDVAATIAEVFNIQPPRHGGKSFLKEVLKG
jgi:phosphopentomutase